MKRTNAIVFLILLIGSALVSGCADAAPSGAEISQPDASAYWPSDGWRTSTPEEQGMDSGRLVEMLEAIQDRGHDINAVLVIRNGYLVLDATLYPYRRGSRHVIHSCTKSIVSALIGIAIEQGYIEGVDQPLLDLFPGRTVANLDADKASMTLEHVLTMTTGFMCRDSYLYDWEGLREMSRSPDWIQYMIDLPMSEAPGTRFEYCNGASFLLSAILQETTGMTTLEFAEEHLFQPLGISDLGWPANPQGITYGWGEMRMLPHDMAKIGYLYLREGVWDGRQVVPSDWVEASTQAYISATLEDGYGYQWWVDSSGMYMALGYSGQFIFVAPDQDMVVVFVSQLPEWDFYAPQILLNAFILPAARSSGPLPDNPDDLAALTALLEALEQP